VEGASCPNGHNVQEGFVFCPACGATIACPNGHPVREGAKFCPQCGNAYATPNVSKATEMVTLAAKVGGEASDLLASPVSKPTGGVDIADVMAGESKTTKCPKCLVVFSRDLFESHRDTCRHRLVTCPKCNNLFGSETLERHLQNCGTRIVSGTPSGTGWSWLVPLFSWSESLSLLPAAAALAARPSLYWRPIS